MKILATSTTLHPHITWEIANELSMQVLQAWWKGGGHVRPTVYRYPGLNVLQNIFSINVRASNGIDHFDWISQARLSLGRRESGQFPIIISYLTHQEFLGVLIGLVTNGGVRLPFLACCLERRKTYPCRMCPNLCLHLLNYGPCCWICNTKAWWEFDQTLSS